mgnify:CR=1 FL=1
MSAMVRATSSRVLRNHSFRIADRGQPSRPSRMKPSGQMPSRMLVNSPSQLQFWKVSERVGSVIAPSPLSGHLREKLFVVIDHILTPDYRSEVHLNTELRTPWREGFKDLSITLRLKKNGYSACTWSVHTEQHLKTIKVVAWPFRLNPKAHRSFCKQPVDLQYQGKCNQRDTSAWEVRRRSQPFGSHPRGLPLFR